MKKNLLFGVLTLLSLSVNAQNQKISFEESEGFTIGNLNNQKIGLIGDMYQITTLKSLTHLQAMVKIQHKL